MASDHDLAAADVIENSRRLIHDANIERRALRLEAVKIAASTVASFEESTDSAKEFASTLLYIASQIVKFVKDETR